MAIETLNPTKEVSSPPPAKAVFGAVKTLLATIRVGLLPTHVGKPLDGIRRIRRPKRQISLN